MKTSAGVTASAAMPDPPATRCGPPELPAQVVTFETSDRVLLDGAVVGSGERGVLLVHEAGVQVLCGWWPYAARLAGRGFRVLIFDLRCYGLSDCPARGTHDHVADVAAAAAELRRQGSASVALVGASYGGSIALVAAARLGGISAVVDLSGDEITTTIGGQGPALTATRAAAKVEVPALLAVARYDPYISLADERTVYRRIRSRSKRLVVLAANAGHGWDMLRGSRGRWSRLEHIVTAFLHQH